MPYCDVSVAYLKNIAVFNLKTVKNNDSQTSLIFKLACILIPETVKS